MRLNDIYRAGFDGYRGIKVQWRWTWRRGRAERWVARLNRQYPTVGWYVVPDHLYRGRPSTLS
jgi:hypothetical protein